MLLQQGRGSRPRRSSVRDVVDLTVEASMNSAKGGLSARESRYLSRGPGWRRSATPRLQDVPEKPSKPEAVALLRNLAKGRAGELQDIFQTRHAGRVTELRNRLVSLDGEAAQLHQRIAQLQLEHDKAKEQRMAKGAAAPTKEFDDSEAPMRNSMSALTAGPRRRSEGERPQSGSSDVHEQTMMRKTPTEDWPGPKRPTCLKSKTFDGTSPFPLASATLPPGATRRSTDSQTSKEAPPDLRSDSPQLRPAVTISELGELDEEDQDSKYEVVAVEDLPDKIDEELEDELQPAMNKRLIESKYREASCIHDNSIAHMRKELMELDRWVQKNQSWMKHLETQVLKAEVAKSRHQIRLSHANKRVESLGKDLSRSYDHMAQLLDQRLDVENIAARNDALAAYLNSLRNLDIGNGRKFEDNKEDLAYLLERCRRSQESRLQLAEVMGLVQGQRSLAEEVAKQAQELVRLAEQMQQLWRIIELEREELSSGIKRFAIGYKNAKGMSWRPHETIAEISALARTIHDSQDKLATDLRQFFEAEEAAFPFEKAEVLHDDVRQHKTTAAVRGKTRDFD